MRAGQSELCVGRTAAQQQRWSAPLCALDNILRFPRVCLCSPAPLCPDAQFFSFFFPLTRLLLFCLVLFLFFFGCRISNLISGYETEMKQNILFCSAVNNQTLINTSTNCPYSNIEVTLNKNTVSR